MTPEIQFSYQSDTFPHAPLPWQTTLPPSCHLPTLSTPKELPAPKFKIYSFNRNLASRNLSSPTTTTTPPPHQISHLQNLHLQRSNTSPRPFKGNHPEAYIPAPDVSASTSIARLHAPSDLQRRVVVVGVPSSTQAQHPHLLPPAASSYCARGRWQRIALGCGVRERLYAAEESLERDS